MKIATFNINGVKARIETLCDWLDDSAPDVAILQEIKSVDDGFPRQMIEDRGYTVETPRAKGVQRGGDPVEIAAGGCDPRPAR